MLYHRRLHLFTTCHTAIRVWAPFLLQPLQCVGSPHPFKVFVFSFFVLFRFLFCCYLLKQYESLCACFELLHWENSCMILFIKSTIFLHDDFESPTNTSPWGGESFFISLPPTFIQILLKMAESADGARQVCSLQRALIRCRDDISSTLPSPVPSSIPDPCHPHKETNGHIPVAPLTTRTFLDIVSAPKKVLRPMAPRAGFVKKAQRKRKNKRT